MADTFWVFVFCFGWWLQVILPIFLAIAFFTWVGWKLQQTEKGP